jgi:hypothetical protein
MMFGFQKRACGLCGRAVRVRHAFRAPDRLDSFVCRLCVEQWERGGRSCGECQAVVTGRQDVGAFFELRALGHADCGGVQLFAA